MSKLAIFEGSTVFRLVSYSDGLYDVTDGLKNVLNESPILSHDEAMVFIHRYSNDNNILNMKYTLVEAKREV